MKVLHEKKMLEVKPLGSVKLLENISISKAELIDITYFAPMKYCLMSEVEFPPHCLLGVERSPQPSSSCNYRTHTFELTTTAAIGRIKCCALNKNILIFLKGGEKPLPKQSLFTYISKFHLPT